MYSPPRSPYLKRVMSYPSTPSYSLSTYSALYYFIALLTMTSYYICICFVSVPLELMLHAGRGFVVLFTALSLVPKTLLGTQEGLNECLLID